MKKMLVLFILMIGYRGLDAQGSRSVIPTCPTMEMGIVADRPDGSTRKFPAGPRGVVLLTGKPLLTIDDFTDANVSVTEGQVVLNVAMTAESAKSIQAFSSHNVGKTLAFVVNGRVINMPKILDPITGRGFLIGPLERDEAQKLADSINHKAGGCRETVRFPSASLRLCVEVL